MFYITHYNILIKMVPLVKEANETGTEDKSFKS